VFAQQSGLIYDKLIRHGDEVFYNVPVGLCEDYPEETTTKEIMRNDLELLKNSGTKLLRISFGWDAIENEKDKYDWLFWDDFVKMAVDEYGITLVPYICYMPRWNSTGENDSLWFWNYTPKDYDEFGQFVKDLVNRYKPWIKSWELWNEPDIWVYWRGNSEQFAKFTKIGSKAVREADPNALIVLGGLAHNTNFTRELFRDHGISPFVDVVNIHNYFETWSGKPIEDITSYVNEISDIVNRWGNKQSIWMAEVGYSTWRMEGSKVSDDYNAYYDYEHTPEYQAVELIKTLSLVLSTEKLAAITWYEIKDLPMVENVIGDNNNRNLGVAYYDYKPKPALTAISFFHKLFAQKYKSIDNSVVIKKTIGSDCIAHSFENEDGSIITVVWLQTTNYGKRINNKSGMMKDTRNEKVDFTFPYSLKGEITLFDELGNKKDIKSVNRSDEEITINNFELEGGKIYIVKIDK
jgi:hypothetical protein